MLLVTLAAVAAGAPSMLRSGAAPPEPKGLWPVALRQCRNSEQQKWDVVDGGLTPAGGRCLSPVDGQAKRGESVGVVQCQNKPDEQLWNYSHSDGQVYLRPDPGHHKHFCLCAGNSFEHPVLNESSPILLATCGNVEALTWQYYPKDKSLRPKSNEKLCLAVIAQGSGGGGDGGITGGGVFLIIFFCGGAVYLVSGAAFNYHKGERGVDLVPNRQFWQDFPMLVKDGAVYAADRVRGAGQNAYSSVV